MIENVYILDNTRSVIGLIDAAESIIWNVQYYGTGDFEIYTSADDNTLTILAQGNYVIRNDREEVGLIEKVEITYDQQNGLMISASGRFAKALLDRRLIYNLSGNMITPVVSSGNVETAVRALVNSNIINAANTNRNISYIVLGAIFGITDTIQTSSGSAGEKQTSYSNLLEYTDGLLQEYQCGSKMILDSNKNLAYSCYKGIDRSVDNAAGNEPIVFSQEFDNLLSSDFNTDETNYRNVALIGGAGEGTERFFVLLGSDTGDQRREIFINASDQSRSYEENGERIEYTDAEYSNMLETAGLQKLTAYKTITTLEGEIDVTYSPFKFGIDYNIGDIVTIQDNTIGVYSNVHILQATEVQDDSGYSISVQFGA